MPSRLPSAFAAGRLALSADESAIALGVSVPTVYKALKTGGLRSRKIGTRRLIAVAELERWLMEADAETAAS